MSFILSDEEPDLLQFQLSILASYFLSLWIFTAEVEKNSRPTCSNKLMRRLGDTDAAGCRT